MIDAKTLTDTLDIIYRIDQLYDTAWNHLIVLITVLTLFIGVIIPLLIQWAQRRFFKLEAQSIENELRSHVDLNIKSKLEKEIEEKFETLDQRINTELDKKYNRLEGGILMAQGHTFFANKAYLNALDNYLLASSSSLTANDELNLQRSLNMAVECLTKISSNDLEVEEEQETSFTNLIKKLKENNDQGRYDDYIRNLRRSYKKVKKEQN